MPYNPEVRGKAGKLKTIMGMDVFMFYSSDAPTRNDMSAGKDFTMEPGGPEVLSEEKTLETVDTLYWSTDRQVTCPAAAARLANVFSFIISPCYRGLFGSKAFRCLRTPQTGD